MENIKKNVQRNIRKVENGEKVENGGKVENGENHVGPNTNNFQKF